MLLSRVITNCMNNNGVWDLERMVIFRYYRRWMYDKCDFLFFCLAPTKKRQRDILVRLKKNASKDSVCLVHVYVVFVCIVVFLILEKIFLTSSPTLFFFLSYFLLSNYISQWRKPKGYLPLCILNDFTFGFYYPTCQSLF